MKQQTESRQFIDDFFAGVCDGEELGDEAAARIMAFEKQTDIFHLAARANCLRERFSGNCIDLCAIVNAKSGRCTEDCAFCGQSVHHRSAGADTYPFMGREDIVQQAMAARSRGVRRFSIVTSGRGVVSGPELDAVCDTVAAVSEIEGLEPCASLGIVSRAQLRALKAAGLKRYHHNYETAESVFPSICSTHRFSERVETIEAAQAEGLEICAGGILGLGETAEQRIELASIIRRMNVDSVPLNFLNPLPGTPLEGRALLEPLQIVKAIALFRFMLPAKEIRICGGREVCLRTLQPFVYCAGASGIMMGNYLTTEGRSWETDIQEIRDMGLSVR